MQAWETPRCSGAGSSPHIWAYSTGFTTRRMLSSTWLLQVRRVQRLMNRARERARKTNVEDDKWLWWYDLFSGTFRYWIDILYTFDSVYNLSVIWDGSLPCTE